MERKTALFMDISEQLAKGIESNRLAMQGISERMGEMSQKLAKVHFS